MDNAIPAGLQHLTSASLRERAFRALDTISRSQVCIIGLTVSLFDWAQRDPEGFDPNLLHVEHLERVAASAQVVIDDRARRQADLPAPGTRSAHEGA